MVIFVNDDRAYLSWIAHHRNGFVLAGKWRPPQGHSILHRATCPEIKSGSSKRTHWTTAGRWKACSLECDELLVWGHEQSGHVASACDSCRPQQLLPAEPISPAQLTRLESNILDYVLDTAVIHMDHEYPPYRLSVADVAACMDKTPRQLESTLQRLVDNGLLSREPRYALAANFAPRQLIFPTGQALRTLLAFQDAPEATVAAELHKLTAPYEE